MDKKSQKKSVIIDMNAPLRGKPHLDIDRVIHQVENSKDKKEE